MGKRVLILMTTYNGEKYLAQQIDSIMHQTYNNWKLIIRDDGSIDDTIKILSEYKKRDDRIEVFQNTSSKHGAYLNFWTLIHIVKNEYIDYDYYFFSDQDDVWEPDKIETMIFEGEKISSKKPLLLYGDMRVINQENQLVYESLNQMMGIGEMSGYSLLFTHGFLWGCDICVNRELFTRMPLLPLDNPNIGIMSHDNYMGKYALLKGKIKYIDQIMINHRRHDNNTTDSYSMRLTPSIIIKRYILRLDALAKVHARVYNQTLVFLEQLSINGMVSQDMEQITVALRHGGIKMVKTMIKLSVKRKQKSRTIGIYLIALTKKYQKYLVV